MTHPSWRHRRSVRGAATARTISTSLPETLPVLIDVRRADLYRILDQIARTPPQGRADVILEFELAWKGFKEAVSKDG
jgi:hypothetical protein